jgi:hypothetical protein
MRKNIYACGVILILVIGLLVAFLPLHQTANAAGPWYVAPGGDYSGPTLTQALQIDSPAINAGNPVGCKDHLDNPMDFDQRGFPRVQRCDLGAYEFQTEIHKLFLPILVKPMTHSDDFNDNSLDTDYWMKVEEVTGVTVQETGKEVKVYGTSHDTTWRKSGLRTPSFPKKSFQVSVDYKMVNMTNDFQKANLRLYFDDGAHYFSVGYDDILNKYVVAYRDVVGYHVQPNIVPPFGDEGTAFHTLKIIFNSSTNTARGYVDDVLVDSLTNNFFTSPMYVQFHQASNIAGSFDVDCRFDNFSIGPVQ